MIGNHEHQRSHRSGSRENERGTRASRPPRQIQTSKCKFDTSPSALVELKEAGVADDVLMEMVRNPNGGARHEAEPVVPPTPAFATPSQPEIKERPSDNLPEYGDISEIRKFRRVLVIADDIDSQNAMINALQQYDGLEVVTSPECAGASQSVAGLPCC